MKLHLHDLREADACEMGQLAFMRATNGAGEGELTDLVERLDEFTPGMVEWWIEMFIPDEMDKIALRLARLATKDFSELCPDETEIITALLDGETDRNIANRALRLYHDSVDDHRDNGTFDHYLRVVDLVSDGLDKSLNVNRARQLYPEGLKAIMLEVAREII